MNIHVTRDFRRLRYEMVEKAIFDRGVRSELVLNAMPPGTGGTPGAGRPDGSIDIMPRERSPNGQAGSLTTRKWQYAEKALQYAEEMLERMVHLARNAERRSCSPRCSKLDPRSRPQGSVTTFVVGGLDIPLHQPIRG